MSKLILSILLIIVTFSFMTMDAEAKRFGAGKSFGFNRTSSTRSFSNSETSSRLGQSATAARAGMSKWLGPLAGFALGGLMASLFMGHGFGTGMMSWAVLAVIGFLLWQVIGRLRQPSREALSSATFQAEPVARTIDRPRDLGQPAELTPLRPTQFIGFDVPSFLRHAKTVFIRLQAAYDHKNLADIREFTAPEVFAEIQMQLHERDHTALNQTEVVSLEAELMEHTHDPVGPTASVLFSALIREEAHAAPAPIKEIWHFRKTADQALWTVIGIQQAE